MQTFENLLLQNYCDRILRYYCIQTNSPWVCVILVCSNGGATYIVGELIAKDNLNMENLMQTFENLLLQNYLTKFLDIAYKDPHQQTSLMTFDLFLVYSSIRCI